MQCFDNWNDESLGGIIIDQIREEVIKYLWSWLYPVPVGGCKRSPVNVYQSVATLHVWTCAKASKINLKTSLFIRWYGTLKETVKELSNQATFDNPQVPSNHLVLDRSSCHNVDWLESVVSSLSLCFLAIWYFVRWNEMMETKEKWWCVCPKLLVKM